MYYDPQRYRGKPEDLPPAPPIKVEQRWCIRCAMNTLIKMCWYLFQRDHETCNVWVCYRCKVRLNDERGEWYYAPDSWVHTEFGYGDKVGES